jgi:trafficking protein particle complex subunit 5
MLSTPRAPRHAVNIIDRPVARSKLDVPTVSLSAYAYLFSELISYAMDRAASVTELEERLERVGHDVGLRAAELLAYRERPSKRRCDVLDALKHIHSVAWPALFGKPADDLQQANAADDEFMIRDAAPLVCRHISVPRSYASFVPGAIVAGIVRGLLDAASLPARCGRGCAVTVRLLAHMFHLGSGFHHCCRGAAAADAMQGVSTLC